MRRQLKIIVIDNFDSFTYNLVDQFRMLGTEVGAEMDTKISVYRNDTAIANIFDAESLRSKNTVILLSPGPGTPDSAGNTLAIINQFAGKLPIMGVCLGHQAIVQHFGGTIGPAKTIVHGKSDDVFFQDDMRPIFGTLTSPFRAARYHSLAAITIPAELEVIASSKEEVMAVRHRQLKILGYQFHPESILTTQGQSLLKAGLDWLLN